MATKVLIDTDPGVDDAIALTTALGHPDLSVIGLTTVAGNTTLANTTRNALSILTMAGRTDVPVAAGCERPLVGDLTTAEWVHGEGGLRGDLPAPEAAPVDAHAADFIADAAREHGDDLVVVGIGPPTNLALALAREPDLPSRVSDIYLMGGAFRGPGNVTPAAEANFHNDPEAASRVVEDGSPRLVGLDVTEQATVPRERVRRHGGDLGNQTPDDRGDQNPNDCGDQPPDDRGPVEDGPLATVDEWLNYPDESLDFRPDGAHVVHDTAVVADVAADVLEFDRYAVEVDTTDGPSRGASVADLRDVTGHAPNAWVATDIDVQTYRDVVIENTLRLFE